MMPRDFRSFAKENANIKNEDKQKTAQYEEILNKYKNMNSNDLMSNLITEALKLKREGKLDNASLQGLKSTLSPFLNNEQQEMLNSIIKTINEQV